jgi:hypothetical protein
MPGHGTDHDYSWYQQPNGTLVRSGFAKPIVLTSHLHVPFAWFPREPDVLFELLEQQLPPMLGFASAVFNATTLRPIAGQIPR